MNKVIAVIVTIVVGYLGSALGYEIMNWPQLGSVLAVITMGLFLWNAVERKAAGEDGASQDDT